MIEILITATIFIGIILFFIKQKTAAYVIGGIGFAWLAFYQLTQGQTVGLIALIFTVGCIERLIDIWRPKKSAKK
ncbi:MAG TPA: hypothetical protein VFO38_06085 [Candidatus Saccharimonadales bacterium]|nr:hypothetical protein [Candidatus Saccharimonadales bacterium]